MIKRYTTVGIVTNDEAKPTRLINVATEEVASVMDFGTNPDNQLPMLQLNLSSGAYVLVYGTELGFLTNIEDMTVTL